MPYFIYGTVLSYPINYQENSNLSVCVFFRYHVMLFSGIAINCTISPGSGAVTATTSPVSGWVKRSVYEWSAGREISALSSVP